MIKLTMKDGSVREVESGQSLYEIAKAISGRLGKEAVSAMVDGEERDLSYRLDRDATISILTFADEQGAETYRHTTSHMLAQAVKRLFPGTKLAIGPAIKDGFYYDFDSEHVFTPEDLEKIEAEMKKIAKESLEIERFELPREEAIRFVQERGEDYKVELIADIPEGEAISFYRQGEFVDLCGGCHVKNTGDIKAIKLLSLAGAYWRGSEKNKMLQRIYGTSYPKASDLEAHLQRLEEAKLRDHRKLGKELDIFMVSQNVGAGLPFWLPNGATIRRVIERFIVDKEIECGYNHVYTPILANVDLYKISGHWDHYQDSMFAPMDLGNGELLVLRPMNCPHHMEVYNNDVHSYREFPIRIAELGMMHRYEMSGALSGLQRVREMTLNDAHIFVRPDQIEEEFKRVVNFILAVYKDFNIHNYKFRLSYRDPANKTKYFDDDNMWNHAEKMLKKVMDDMGVSYYEAIGEAAFYGPKLDVQVTTAIGLEETLSTVQLDFLLPERFDLTYVGEDGKNNHRPVVIHRGVLSTMERFIAYLIEEYVGKFPTWLAPVQVQILTIADRHIPYCEELKAKFEAKGIRVKLDSRAEKIGFKIREARLRRSPYMLVIGDDEVNEKCVAVRSREVGELGKMDSNAFLEAICEEIRTRALTTSFQAKEASEQKNPQQ
ncbi:MAG: threonine--tRNA ligase [Bacillota bacterium]|nr:threonine--tRNA ligase [Bacillota bacterium]